MGGKKVGKGEWTLQALVGKQKERLEHYRELKEATACARENGYVK